MANSTAPAKLSPSSLNNPLNFVFMNSQKKVTVRQQTDVQQQASNQQQSQQPTVAEFATVEELLRHDTLHTPVPPAIAQRREESVSQLPAPRRPWWRRLLGGSGA